jgi:predicted TIM-barrel fold metal-dependent hydrolase
MLSPWRPIEDTVASFIVHGALTRFPNLNIAVIENGSSWVQPLMNTLKDVYKKMPQDFPEEPITVMKRQVHISPFWEEDLGALADLLGEDRVLFGSDFPHPEGLADPCSYVSQLEGVAEPIVRKIMGGNLARLIGVDKLVPA